MKYCATKMLLAACLTAMPFCSQAGTVTFEEYAGVYGNDAPLPQDQLPLGLPDGITARWTGFSLHTSAGDTPMSVFPVSDRAGEEDAAIRFSGPLMVQSINTLATTWGSAMSVVAKRWGVEVWRYASAGNDTWQKVTLGAGKEIDTLIFEGQWNHYDDIIVEAAPDADGDGYTDADEIATGHNPNDPNDNPSTKAIADSAVQFTTTGIQGENDQYYGYRNFTADGGGESYDPTTGFIEFAPEAWNGGGWVLGGNPPWTNLGQRELHPNTGTGGTHWVIRRWVANQLTKVTPLAIRWHAHKANLACGNGITGALYNNGRLVDKAIIAAPDGIGVTHTYYINVAPGDRIDLILSPKGTDGVDSDGCDGSQNWFLVDPTIPADPRQPDGSIFVPIGSGDTDNDGLPDVWEKIYFPGDLTKLTKTGDYDKEGLTDLGEYERSSDPTKPDTDADGLSDLVETGTGIYVSKTDTGSSSTKPDSDSDGISDSAEVNRTPPTNPNKPDTDGDGYSDADEMTAGSNPVDANDTPVTFVMAHSQSEFSGVQGSNGWYNGYRIFNPVDGTIDYDPNQGFIPFPGGDGLGSWDGTSQLWDGNGWDMNQAGEGPWTELRALSVHPNGTNSAPTIGGAADATIEHWVTRRWVAAKLTTNTPVTIVWKVRKSNLANQGVTGLLLINGHLVDSKSIFGNNGVGETRRYQTTLKKTDIIDLALSPANPDGDRHDWSDASETSFWVDARPLPPADIQITSPAYNATEGKFSFKWNSQPGAKYKVTTSSDLKLWAELQIVDSGGTETTFTDTLGSLPPSVRFYRVTLQ